MYARSIKNPIASTTSYRFNVKMDKRNVLMCKQNCGETNVVKGGHDQRDIGELHNVCEHELLFRHKKHNQAHRIECFSALNGLTAADLAQLEFVGIAVGSCAPDSPMAPQGFTAARAGLHTIMNNGPDTIDAGCKVYWWLPNNVNDAVLQTSNYPRLQGVPNSKRCAIVSRTEKGKGEGQCVYLGMALSKAQKGQPLDILLN